MTCKLVIPLTRTQLQCYSVAVSGAQARTITLTHNYLSVKVILLPSAVCADISKRIILQK